MGITTYGDDGSRHVTTLELLTKQPNTLGVPITRALLLLDTTLAENSAGPFVFDSAAAVPDVLGQIEGSFKIDQCHPFLQGFKDSSNFSQAEPTTLDGNDASAQKRDEAKNGLLGIVQRYHCCTPL
jgi:hypothetical protein